MYVPSVEAVVAELALGVLAVGGLEWISSFFKRGKVDPDEPEEEEEEEDPEDQLPRIPPEERRPDGLYQWNRFHGERHVGIAPEAEVDAEAKSIRFPEIHNSDLLLIPDEAEFDKYRIQIQAIEEATKVDKLQEQKGRILYGVKAKIVGYLEH